MKWIKKLFGRDVSDSTANTPADGAPPEASTGSNRLIPLARVEIPEDEQDQPLYQDQILRKNWAEDVVREHGIAVNPYLPVIESEAEARPRTVQQIAERLLALTIVALKGEGLEQDRVLAIIAERGAMRLFTPKEHAFITAANPSEHDRIQFVWRYEAAWVMFWALNFTKQPLAFPGAICDVPLLVGTVRDTHDLAVHGRQSTNNLLNEADLIYRYHWAIRQAQIDGAPTPGALEAGVVMERHYALNWLIGYDNQDWDHVSTDT